MKVQVFFMNYKILEQRCRSFTQDCIALTKLLTPCFLADHVSRQLVRSSTSLTANLKASYLAQSKAAYIAKLSIAIEELDETRYWIELLRDNDLLNSELFDRLFLEANELIAILWTSRRTAKMNLRNSS